MTGDVVQLWCMSRKFEVRPGRRVLVINAYRLNPAALGSPPVKRTGAVLFRPLSTRVIKEQLQYTEDYAWTLFAFARVENGTSNIDIKVLIWQKQPWYSKVKLHAIAHAYNFHIVFHPSPLLLPQLRSPPLAFTDLLLTFLLQVVVSRSLPLSASFHSESQLSHEPRIVSPNP